MRSELLLLALLAAPATAHADTIDMGKWDCQGSKVTTVIVAPGAHDYMWHGSCGGEEGHDVILTPRKHLKVKLLDDGHGNLGLHVENPGTKPRKVKVHVFVGFA